ncbi:MAG TPA: hypothetical protein VFE46_09110 [Pirellulales bacterium]|jgi:phage FluMu protein Com|nr:hypothetical protein [Pirellulales bacterium]
MKIKFKCPCGKILLADSAAAGKKAKCPNCGQVVQVPSPPEQSPKFVSPEPKSAPQPAPQAAQTKIPDLEDDLSMAPLDDMSLAANESSSMVVKGANTPVLKGKSKPAPAAKTAKPLPPSAGNKTIWNETEADAYGLKSEPEQPCPKCGKPMPAQAVLCVACGYNRKTGATVAGLTGAPGGDPATAKAGSKPSGRGLSRPRFSRNTLRIVIACAVGGVALLAYGLREKKLADAASQQPEKISLAQLIQRGPEGNPNLILSNFQLCSNFAYQAKMDAGAPKGDWTAVWVPIVAADPAAGAPGIANQATNVQALIYSTHTPNQQELIAKLAVPQLPGMVTNQIQSLNSKEKDILSHSYPTINFDRCIIFEEGRTPSSSEKISLLLAGGSALMFIALCFIVKPIFWPA